MAANYDDVVAKIAELPVKDRAKLAHWIISSLEGEEADDPAEVKRLWAEEIKRRVAELDRGEAETFDGEEVMAGLRARLVK